MPGKRYAHVVTAGAYHSSDCRIVEQLADNPLLVRIQFRSGERAVVELKDLSPKPASPRARPRRKRAKK